MQILGRVSASGEAAVGEEDRSGTSRSVSGIIIRDGWYSLPDRV